VNRLFIELYLDEDVRRLMRVPNHVTADEMHNQVRYI
jgi:hypothetical protein